MTNEIKKYTKLGVDKIKDVEILESDDLTEVSNLSKELQRVFEVKQVWRTETEMRYSVLNDVSFPTPASKYWQCIREQDSFFSQLIQLSCDYQKTQGELELLEVEYDEIKGVSKKSKALRKIKDAEIKQKKFGLMNMRLQAHDRVREIDLWETLKKEQMEKDDFDIRAPSVSLKVKSLKRWQEEMKVGQMTNQADLYRHSKANLETMEKDN